MSSSENTEQTFSFLLDAPGDSRDCAAVQVIPGDGDASQTLVFAGSWTLGNAGFAPLKITLRKQKTVQADCRQLENWDSRFLAAVLEIRKCLEEHGMTLAVEGLPDGARKMLDSMLKTSLTRKEEESAEKTFKGRLKELLRVRECEDILSFIGDILLGLWHYFRRGSVTRRKDVVDQIYRTGPTALGIISLISFLMGLILAFIGSIPLKFFSAEIFIASLLGIGILRLMAPVMVGIVMAGRTGAAFAAELGTMVVNEELDAMKTFGIPTFEFLVIPRCLAMMLMLPLLGIFANLVGVLGGMLVGLFYMDLGCEEFFQQLIDSTTLNDLFVGLFTCWVFGFLISACGCYQGMKCGRNAEAVGKATTSAVVSSIVCIVIATALITLLTVNLKI